MSEPLEMDLPPELRRILGFMADVGVLGSSPGEVAAYLIMRGIDDMFRAGVLKLGDLQVATGRDAT